MKRIVLALFLIGAAPAAGQTPAQPTDWRAIVSERDRGRIENWRENFDRAVELADSAPPVAWHGITREELRALSETELVPYGLNGVEGRWRCRVHDIGRYHVGRNDWLHCRVFRDGKHWRIEKRSGQLYFAGTFFPDAILGTIYVGADWGSGTRSLAYGQDPGRDTVGVLRRADKGLMRIFLSFEDYLQVVEVDIRHRLRDRHLIAPAARVGND